MTQGRSLFATIRERPTVFESETDSLPTASSVTFAIPLQNMSLSDFLLKCNLRVSGKMLPSVAYCPPNGPAAYPYVAEKGQIFVHFSLCLPQFKPYARFAQLGGDDCQVTGATARNASGDADDRVSPTRLLMQSYMAHTCVGTFRRLAVVAASSSPFCGTYGSPGLTPSQDGA